MFLKFIISFGIKAESENSEDVASGPFIYLKHIIPAVVKEEFSNLQRWNSSKESRIYPAGSAPGASMATAEPTLGPTQEASERLSTYRGRPQPPVNERLQQIYNFLADEDYYRCLNFAQKLRDIKDYINDLETGAQVFAYCDEDLLGHIHDQIEIHDRWIEEATQITPFEFNSPLLLHRNRFNIPGWKPKPGLVSFELEDLPTYEINPPVPEAKLHVTLQEDTGRKPPNDPDPFEYTKKVARYREMQDVIAQTIRGHYNSGNALAFNLLPRNFKGPWAPPAPEILLQKWENERDKLMDLSYDLIATHRRAPRLSLSQVVHMITTIFQSDTPCDAMLLESDLTPSDIEKLTVLTRRSTHRTKPSNLRGPHLTFVARVNGLIRGGGTWPEEVETPVKVETLFRMVNEKGSLNLDYDGMLEALQYMHDDGNLRYDEVTDEVRAPYPNSHPEDRAVRVRGERRLDPLPITLSEWAYLGLRLATATMKIASQVEMAHSDPQFMDRAATAYTNNLAMRIRAWEKEVDSNKSIPSLVEIATPLVKHADRGQLTEDLARKILQEKIVEESNRNWEARATPTTIWNWTRDREPLTEQRLSIDRWTPAIQHVGDLEKENMYLEWVKNQPPADPQDGNSRKRTTFIPGEPIFPLGETVEQEEAISKRMDEHLRDLGDKEFEGVYGPQGAYTLKEKELREAEAKAKAAAEAKEAEKGVQAKEPQTGGQGHTVGTAGTDHAPKAGATVIAPEAGAQVIGSETGAQVNRPKTGEEANASET
ncbi:hypothetical protein V494_04956 [Pseudogymnoascus sp. VKM F-4513 (FW-928)]|nr:hypothetical protein V494_04956 [Pseudogymnoascus sp. VKM F-4513 (FW-928)]